MTDIAGWEKGNEEYLAAALSWLRLRFAWHLMREKPSISLPASPLEESQPSEKKRFSFLRRTTLWSDASIQAPRMLPPAPVDLVTEEQGAQAATRMAEAEKIDPPPALLIAANRFGLSAFERSVLLLCAAMELDPSIASYCARANDDASRAYPTFALALSLFEKPTWDALSPERPLRYWQLIEINQPGAQPLTSSAIRADERIVNYIKGLNYLDDRLAPFVFPLPHIEDQSVVPASQHAVILDVLDKLKTGTPSRSIPAINLLGADLTSKQLVATGVADALSLHLYRLPARVLPTNTADLEKLARLWQRDSILLPIWLYLDAHENQTDEATIAAVNRFLARTGGVIFLSSRDAWSGLNQSMTAIDVDKPTAKEQRAAWATSLDQSENDADPAALAGQFNLNLTTIKQIVRNARDSGDQDISTSLWSGCLANVRPHLDNLAQRLVPKATLAEIILPEAEKKLLTQIADQIAQRSKVYEDWGFANKMNRGLGIGALFAGDSGTGKTMAAEGIANQLRLDLYRIDLSAVVSKFIGETEKNLRRLFDAAEDGGAILFFDEADALFGKRSEVKDSHDRYANIEINYLLQRIESYRGLAILATNMKDALDEAFMRRLRFVVNFPYPTGAEREAIWAGIFPSQTKTGKLDFDRLARLDLTGGNIQTIALNAAFLAAHSGSDVTMSLIFEAARAEFRKLGRFINESDFRWKEEERPTLAAVAGSAKEMGNENLRGAVA